MYERSAIVLEKYFEKMLGLSRENNIKQNYENYEKLVKEVKEYQKIVEEEDNIIKKFDEVAEEIEEIQKEQSNLYQSNIEMEGERNQLFSDLGENPSFLDQRLQKIEEKLDENNEKIKELRERYVKALVIFTERQKERNRYTRTHRTAEATHIDNVEKTNKIFNEISEKDVNIIKNFINGDTKLAKQEIIDIMIKNGKNEKVPFNYQIIEKAVDVRMSIAKREAQIYLSIYEKMKKLLVELSNETIKLRKSEKLLRDSSVKLAFLHTEKEYIVDFLDNERMAAMYGKKVHNKLMEDACKNFESDIKQIDNLYELIIKETTSKATKKAYKELYNKTYLKGIEEKEKDFEKEVTSIKINTGTVINSNYWRIEGIKNIYNVFNEEIEEKFDKDLSEFKLEEKEELKNENDNNKELKSKEKKKTKNDIEDKVEKEYIKRNIEINEKDDEDLDYEDEEYDEDFDYEDEEYDEDFNYEDEEYDEDFDYEDEEYDQDFDNEDEEYDEDFDNEDEEYDEDLDNEEEYDEDFDYEDEEYDEDFDYDDEEENEIIEDKIDKIIRNSRKAKTNTKNKNEKGLFGKLFKK